MPRKPKRTRAHLIGAEMPVVNLTTMSRRTRRIPKPLPHDPLRQVRKHVGQSKVQLTIQQMIDLGLVAVTRCPDGAVTNLDPRKGGVMPNHLRPGVQEDGR